VRYIHWVRKEEGEAERPYLCLGKYRPKGTAYAIIKEASQRSGSMPMAVNGHSPGGESICLTLYVLPDSPSPTDTALIVHASSGQVLVPYASLFVKDHFAASLSDRVMKFYVIVWLATVKPCPEVWLAQSTAFAPCHMFIFHGPLDVGQYASGRPCS